MGFRGDLFQNAIFNEDMIFAGKAVMEDDYAIAYVADAKVIHSHNYNCTQQFKRNFDLAVSQADHPEVFGRYPIRKCEGDPSGKADG